MTQSFRIGHGYDVHRLTEGRKLILGGLEIPYARGLLGHSDADVLTHAVIDALLGAAGMDDIGRQFPDHDPAYEGADSIELLKTVHRLLCVAGFEVSNIDATVIAQEPRLSPYTKRMSERISSACGIPADRVNVKACTEERLGFTGSGEGMSAHAVALIVRSE